MTPMTDTAALDLSTLVGRAVAEARTRSVEDVREWRDIARRQRVYADTMGALLDPTAYRRDAKSIAAVDQVAAAYLAFRLVVEKASA